MAGQDWRGLETGAGENYWDHAGKEQIVCHGLSHLTFKAVLARTMQHAHAAAAAAGLDKPTPAMMELKLIQSKQEIENPPDGSQAEILHSK